MTRLLDALARVGDWLLTTQLDDHVCRLSNQISGEDDK